jgi:hypothetical protein
MNKLDYILTHLRIVNLQKKYTKTSTMSIEDENAIVKIYEDYEERKKNRKIKFTALINEDFVKVNNEL